MTLRLPDRLRAQMERHATATYPDEGCGLLLGHLIEGEIRVSDVRTVDNAREDSRRNRYAIDPADVLAAEREAESTGLDLVGFFHSHPDAPAEPSATDLAQASWPGFAYVIVSVLDGRVGDVRAWTLSSDRTRFEEMTVTDRSVSHKGGVPR